MMMTSTEVFGESIGRPDDYDVKKSNILAPFEFYGANYVTYKDYKVMAWGKDNRFPQEAAKVISTTSVLNTGLKFLQNLTCGQGLFACRVTGYDEKGNEQLEPVNDPLLKELLNTRMVRRYLEKVSRDYFKFGCSPVEMIPDSKGARLVGLNPVNPLFARFTEPDEWGGGHCIVSGAWPNTPSMNEEDRVSILPLLMDYDPDLQVEAMQLKGGLKKPFVFAVRDSWSNEDIYSEPVWLPAYVLGWVDIAHMVPQFLKKAYKNQVTWKWHVQIPYSYWDRKFPRTDYADTNARRQAIQKHMDKVERDLCGVENAEKPLFTNYAVNEANGRIEEEWKIEALDNKYKGGENLVTSAAANSEILFTLGVNPNVFGAGMPGGTYAGNQGGSNIREAFLVNIANAWIHRQNFLDPLYMLLRSQGYRNIELRYRNTILTTLDTGAGTQKTLS